ncbi:hypothetical protein ABPG72_007209 [Tetrahymena utriculariae]
MKWSNIVKNGLNSNIIAVKYDQKNNCINQNLITDQVRKALKIKDSNSFKIFTRKNQIYENLSQNSIVEEIDHHHKLKDLEHIKKVNEKDDKSNILKHQNESKINQKSKANNSQSTQCQNTQPDLQQNVLYGEYTKDKYLEKKMISIKMTIYQNQTEWFCCLVLKEENNQEKLETLKEITKDQEANFFRFCIYLDKLADSKQRQVHYNNLLNTSDLQIRDVSKSRYLQFNLYTDELKSTTDKQLNQIPKEINVEVELIKGENEQSYIFKISVKDNSRGTDINKIINSLQVVGANNPFNSFSYQLHGFLEWKVNDIIILYLLSL